ncbi:MAG: hypothetical protein K6E94_02510 [Elusimicrobiaceae bacterium]|nr:hypothetical protein [Elusimicrobiaceae bacterium]
MSLIIRNKKKDDGDKRKQLYTWVGCGLVMVLTLVAVVPNLGSDNKPDYSKFSNSRMADLAALPFGTDAEAGNFLRNNPEYQDASNADLLGSLFSSDDRKARQAADKEKGTPPPPDPEYKAIADQNKLVEKHKKVAEKRVEKRKKANKEYADAKKKVNARQARGGKTLQAGKGGSGGGASSGVTGSIWSYQGKNINGSGMPSAHTATAQDYASAKKYGRNVGVYQAGIESAKGANAKDGDTAAAGAMDAFQKGLTGEELAKDAEEAGLDELPEGVSADLRDELAHDLSDDVDDYNDNGDDDGNKDNNNEYSINENCIDNKGNPVWKCFGMKALNEALSMGFGYITWGIQGGFREQKFKKQRNDWCVKNNYASSVCGGSYGGRGTNGQIKINNPFLYNGGWWNNK